MTTTLGTIGKVVDLSAQYGAPAYQVEVTFTMYGLNFRAQRFVRTDAEIDTVWVFQKCAGDWSDEVVGMAQGTPDPTSPCRAARTLMTDRVAKRALHLLAVAEATSIGSEERFAQIEMV